MSSSVLRHRGDVRPWEMAPIFVPALPFLLLAVLLALAAGKEAVADSGLNGFDPARVSWRRVVDIDLTGVFLVGMFMALFVVYGFDTAGTFGEETLDAGRQAPRGVLSAIWLSGLVGAIFLATGLVMRAATFDPALGRHVPGAHWESAGRQAARAIDAFLAYAVEQGLGSTRLAVGDASVNELAEPYDVTVQAVSKHLKVLERAGLISRGRDAQRRPRRLEAKPLEEATEWLEGYREVWEGNFQHLDALLEEMKTKQHKRGPTKR